MAATVKLIGVINTLLSGVVSCGIFLEQSREILYASMVWEGDAISTNVSPGGVCSLLFILAISPSIFSHARYTRIPSLGDGSTQPRPTLMTGSSA